MEYTVQKLGQMAGISTRTLRYFLTANPGSELAQKAADLHRQWLSCY